VRRSLASGARKYLSATRRAEAIDSVVPILMSLICLLENSLGTIDRVRPRTPNGAEHVLRSAPTRSRDDEGGDASQCNDSSGDAGRERQNAGGGEDVDGQAQHEQGPQQGGEGSGSASWARCY